MNKIKTTSPSGRVYEIEQRKNHIAVRTENKEMLLDCSLSNFLASWTDWTLGQLVQNAFSYLDADAREFLITGLLPSEWDEIMNETIGNEN